MGSTSVEILKKSLYQLTVAPPALRTFDGKADVAGLGKSREIGKYDQILLAGNDSLKKTSFDEKERKTDPLYVWTEARSAYTARTLGECYLDAGKELRTRAGM